MQHLLAMMQSHRCSICAWVQLPAQEHACWYNSVPTVIQAKTGRRRGHDEESSTDVISPTSPMVDVPSPHISVLSNVLYLCHKLRCLIILYLCKLLRAGNVYLLPCSQMPGFQPLLLLVKHTAGGLMFFRTAPLPHGTAVQSFLTEFQWNSHLGWAEEWR